MPTLLDLLNLFLIGFVAFSQWRLMRLVMAFARRRGWPLKLVTAALAVYGVVFVFGAVCGFSQVRLPLELPRWVVAVLGAVVHMWGYASGAGWVIYEARRRVMRFAAPPFDPARRRLIGAATGTLVGVPFAAIGYGALVGRTNFRVREVDVPIPHLPQDLEGLRLIHLSDIHLSAFLSERELARVIDAANELRAHAAVVTGDLISARGDPLDACLRQLARLRTDAGVLGSMGNHESYAGALEYAAREGARLGIRFLRHQAHLLRFGGATLNLAGVDYQKISPTRNYLNGAERMVVPGALNVLLSHNPDVFPVAARKGFDLTLSGHTHGGQVTVEILDQSLNPARFFTPFVYGLYREGPACAYVTRGIGTIGIPARIGAQPEIALLRLRKASG